MEKSVNPEDKPLTESQKVFCNEWIFDFNGSRAYLVAYPASSVEAARSSASDLLSKPNVRSYVKFLQDNLSETAGISRLMVLKEHQKMAFSSIAHLHNTWITRKEFEDLTDDQKAAIESIETSIKRIVNDFEAFDVEYIKIKLYSKQKSLDSINRMLGFEAPKKLELSGNLSTNSIKLPDGTELPI